MYRKMLGDHGFKTNVIRAIYLSTNVGLPNACELYDFISEEERERILGKYIRRGGYLKIC